MKSDVTRDDVAKWVGVSGATVSYVLNNTPGIRISKKTREAVRKAAEELGYRRKPAARSLATGRFFQIGVLAPSPSVLFRAYHEGVLRGVWQAASAAGYRIVIDAARPSMPTRFMEERCVDGLIVLAPPRSIFTPSVRERLKRTRMPVVAVGGGAWMTDFACVDIDDRAIGAQAAACILEKGHRRFAVLGGSDDHDTARLRTEGFLSEIQRSNGDPSAVQVIRNGFSTAEAYPDAVRLLREGQVTAIFAINDDVALAVYAAARETGVRIPDELSVIGVDALEAGNYTTPPLTTFRQPLEEMGRKAFAILMNPKERTARKVYQATFLNRGSVAKAGKEVSISNERG